MLLRKAFEEWGLTLDEYLSKGMRYELTEDNMRRYLRKLKEAHEHETDTYTIPIRSAQPSRGANRGPEHFAETEPRAGPRSRPDGTKCEAKRKPAAQGRKPNDYNWKNSGDESDRGEPVSEDDIGNHKEEARTSRKRKAKPGFGTDSTATTPGYEAFLRPASTSPADLLRTLRRLEISDRFEEAQKDGWIEDKADEEWYKIAEQFEPVAAFTSIGRELTDRLVVGRGTARIGAEYEKPSSSYRLLIFYALDADVPAFALPLHPKVRLVRT